jgi:putative methyltransferase (TIGR04325 family)
MGLGSWVRRLPGMTSLRRRLYDRRVRTSAAWRFWGVFASREEAAARAKAFGTRPTGYDTSGMADRGRELYERMHSFDYPALLWLLRGLEDGCRTVVDLGGHLGVKYRAYRRLWDLPSDLRWIVCETPDVVEASRKLAPEDVPPGLSFTVDRSCLADADVLFASGVLQYLDDSLPAILGALPRKPRHLVLNKVPLSDGPEIWTIQNAEALVTYHIMNRERFLEAMAGLGYRLLDSWTVSAYGARIPFAPAGYGTEHNSGLAMTLSG